MSNKTVVYIGGFVGSLIGGYVPALFGVGMFSVSSVIFSGVGGIIGIVLAMKLINN
jgi:hypothetical protein